MRKSASQPFSEVVQSRVARDPQYAAALLAEAMQCFSRGETSVARAHVRDVIKGSIGYAELAERTGTPETSLVRMFGPSGNPTFDNVANVISHLLAASGIELEVRFVSKANGRSAKRSSALATRPSNTASQTRPRRQALR